MREQRTYTGKLIDPYEIKASDICIMDIAHHLSRLCRYGGAVQDFYSVAQHSVHVSTECAPELALWGLLHDAAEAYIGDMVRPVKRAMAAYNELEQSILNYVAVAFELTYPIPLSVIKADNTVLQCELNRFSQAQTILGGMSCKPAKNLFLSQYRNLTGGGCPCGCGLVPKRKPEVA